MKILVVSLLRLGDFIMAAPVVTGLRQKYPKANIDVWVHKPVAALQPIFPCVDRWWTLDRDELQSGLGRAEIPFLTSFDVLKEQCEALSAENYDLIINLTQTRFSGFLMGHLRSKSKLGLTVDSSGRVHFHSPWFRYLNDQASDALRDVIHFTDVFAEGSEVGAERLWNFHSTESGQAEASSVLSSAELIAVQALTSDAKKNWPASSWARALTRLAELRPKAEFVLFASPAEREAVEAIVRAVPDPLRARFKSFVCSLDGALAVLEKSTLLVTGDTSIKHLANSVKAKVVELCLGSSDYRRTGIFKPGSVILQSCAPCAPCPHSGACTQPSHVCAEAFPPEVVATVASHLVDGSMNSIRQIAEQGRDRFKVRMTRRLGNGFWYAGNVCGEEPGQIAQDWVERSVAKFLFNASEKRRLPTFGTEIYRLAEDIRTFPDLKPVFERLDFLEANIETRRQKLLRERLDFTPLADSGNRVVEIGPLRQTQTRLTELEREIEIQFKMVRTLKANLTEKS